ncbi:hypothetical protein TCAL_15152 [Tigriopus californicus]|uniref:Uncharacterized protein n=1 Tax=Tigriopus californicus TaxID=6832 RepID=A0A553NVT8_TIGCA|nr:hypothetical protein TCAL_15152 [Tigriopus californicus]
MDEQWGLRIAPRVFASRILIGPIASHGHLIITFISRVISFGSGFVKTPSSLSGLVRTHENITCEDNLSSLEPIKSGLTGSGRAKESDPTQPILQKCFNCSCRATDFLRLVKAHPSDSLGGQAFLCGFETR